MYQVLTDRDIENLGSMKMIIEAITRSFEEQSNGTLISPPRFRIETDLGDLVFTAGAATALDKVIGFRVYETYKNDVDGHEQIVCVFDSENGVFKGIIIGNLLGALRTGAIGGVAINELSRMDAEQIAVIGTGLQARTQLEAAVAVRNIKNIRVYSRSHDNRETFAQEMSKKLNTDILPVTSSRDCIEGADIVICATNSFTPVFEIDGLKPGAHINTVGSKSARKYEIPFELQL
ncbi:MAG: NAD(P)-binding domain-containing protein [Acidibacillus sp.]|nr:NAD(P)-binding domain-containing protein [Acidibacillus sp.]